MSSICPGHVLDRSVRDRARREFARLIEYGLVHAASTMVYMANMLETDPYAVLGEGSPESKAYARAAGAKDWGLADKIYLDWLKIHDLLAYRHTLYMESLAREFTEALAHEVSRAGTIYRWMDLAELPSYLGGTLKSRTEAGGGSRRYKPFSLWFNVYSGGRPASVTVPVDGEIRRALRPAAYTAVPWSVPSVDERIDSRKHLAYAGETECRLRDGTRVPDGAFISVKRSALDASPDPLRHYSMLESLEDVITVRVI